MRQEVTPSLKNCIAERRGDVDKEKHQMGDATLMYYQILCHNIKKGYMEISEENTNFGQKAFTYLLLYGWLIPASNVVLHPGMRNVNTAQVPMNWKMKQYLAAILHERLTSTLLIK